jgi:alpha-aminoadipic semialdehyde synthase
MSELRDAIGILRETKNKWERRVPLVPEEVRGLIAAGIAVRVERSPTRALADADFEAAGATLVDDATDCRFIAGVKEVKPSQVKPGQTVMCFSHTIKGQSHNMPLLAHFMKQGATLIDYEVIVDDAGVRQVAFGRYAGLAGAHETLWTLAHRLAALGHPSPLTGIKHAVEYRDLAEMVAHTRELLAALRAEGPAALAPFVVAVTGEGRVSHGALEYFALVGAIPCTVGEAIALPTDSPDDRTLRVLHVKDAEIFVTAGTRRFDFAKYLAHPERWLNVGAMYLPYCVALVNGLYWDARFPRLLDDSTLRRMHGDKTLPVALGDVACDIDGGIEWTVMATQNDEPAFVYDPATRKATVGVEGDGVAIMSVDNLPCALPRDASFDFSRALIPFIRAFYEARYDGGVGGLPPALQNAVVVAGGKLTPRHEGLAKFLPAEG